MFAQFPGRRVNLEIMEANFGVGLGFQRLASGDSLSHQPVADVNP
jgi:hypothetical protein